MQLSKDYKPNQSRGFLLLGQPGMGKTTNALSIALPIPYIADLDNNLSGAHRFLEDRVPFYYTIPTTWEDMVKAIKEASSDSKVGSIIIDSFSKLSDLAMEEILRQQGRKAMQLQDWGVFLLMMKKLISEMRSTKKLFIATAHIKPEKDEVSGIVRYFPAIPGQLQHIIGALFSDVLLCECEERNNKHTYQLRTMPNTFYALKNSLGLPPVVTVDQVRDALAKAQ